MSTTHEAEQIVLVLDNLNTHTPGPLYEVFPPAEAKRLADKLEIHYTPKHGSWLNMAETELSVLSRQCLDRRIPDFATLAARSGRLAGAPQHRQRDRRLALHPADARIKLKRLYPSLHE